MHKRVPCLLMMMLACMAAAGCGARLVSLSQPESVRNEHLAVVTVQAGDTLAGLAQSYLGDPQKANWIAEYNSVRTAQTGMRLVIPLSPTFPGGLRPEGYQTVPVLLYPTIAPDPGNDGLSVRAFEDQLRHLRRNGYSTISLDRLTAFSKLRDQLPAKSMVLTFDSAGQWVYDIAYPLLKRYGYTAAIFVPTGRIGRPDQMSWPQLGQMAADGFDIATVGTTAHNLSVVPAGMDAESYLRELEEQIALPISAIAEHLKKECRYFAYPEGAGDDLIVAMLKKHGYRAAFIRQQGENPFFVDPFRIHRIELNGSVALSEVLTTFVTAELR
jgi:peptidoglycan/xylan/chitin deacetylase (PgdA/CDA1 family)